MSKNNYVKTERGEYLVEVIDDNSQWGFYLTDGEQSWDGGFGIAESWKIVKKVPKAVREEMDWLL